MKIVAKLITIGDSISQGFMSGGAARTDLSYSTLVARSLGIHNHYRYPKWPLGGIPLNLEILLRHLSRYYGDDILGLFEWSSAAIRITNFMDRLEDYYERGEGDFRRQDPAAGAGYHNLASFGFTISDAWQVTPKTCLNQLMPNGMERPSDDWFSLPSNAFYRSAMRILNPGGTGSYAKNKDRSQLEWLRHYAEMEDGVENLILWLGSNNALGTILHMKIEEPSQSAAKFATLGHLDRAPYNLWTEDLFKSDYKALLDRVLKIMNTQEHNVKQPGWRIFVGTIPAVTIAPIAKGVGKAVPVKDPFKVLGDRAHYYEYYTYFVFNADDARSASVPTLDREDALRIDTRIAAFNKIIKKVVAKKNKKLGNNRIFLVDINRAFLELAFKRNNGHPPYRFPKNYQSEGIEVNTKYYRARDGRKTAGGVFSLDGVHPSAIGQGLLAHEFLTAMKKAGRKMKNGLDWAHIRKSDDLYSRPLDLVQELFQHRQLLRILVRAMRSETEDVDADEDIWTAG